MHNDKTSAHSNSQESADPNEKGVATEAFVASATADAPNASEQERSAASAPAALEALSGKLGFTSTDPGGAPVRPTPGEEPQSPAETVDHEEIQGTPLGLESPGDKDPSISKLESKLSPLALGLAVLFYMAIGVALASINLTARAFIVKRWVWLLVAAAVIVGILALLATGRWFRRTTAQRRIGMIVFAVIPLVTTAVGGVVFLPPVYKTAALTMIFLLCVCLLPAVMYYLFIATKKTSIMNEFIINLDRLGLLDASEPITEGSKEAGPNETEAERNNRILTYLQKFEAVYGAFPTDLGGLLLQPTDLGKHLNNRRLHKSDGLTFASIFTAETTVPVILATILIALGWLITLPPWRGDPGISVDWLKMFTPQEIPVQFAFIGAYFFSVQLLFRRYVRRDLRPSAYVAVSLRIILAVIGTWVAVAAMSTMSPRFSGSSPVGLNQLLVLGFVIGVFPRVLWQLIRGAVKTFGGSVLRVPSLQTELPISQLDGLTVWHETRLEEEDIENIPNMATADLVDMLLNTRFSPDRIVDWVDQAILYTHLGPSKVNPRHDPRREALRTHGIRTASALIEAYDRSQDRGDLAEFEKILKDTNSDRSPIRSLVDTMQTNPNLRLIQTWRRLLPHADNNRAVNV